MIKKPVVLINLSSSTSGDITAPMKAMFRRYGYPEPLVIVGEAAQMDEMLKAAHAARGDLYIAYGGDGTAAGVMTVARSLSQPFIALPGGTMNVLMQGLYGSDEWEECLVRALACAGPRAMTSGRVQDASGEVGTFQVGAMFGKPTGMNQAREGLRDGDVMAAARDAVAAIRETAIAPGVEVSADEGASWQRTDIAVLTCPFMNGAALNPDTFDVQLYDQVTGAKVFSLGMSALSGNLRTNAGVTILAPSRLTLRAEEPIEALLDGEPHLLNGPVRVTLDRDSGWVLAPYPSVHSPSV